ncbi:MAG: hypothetical protein QGH66_06555, partial [Dehalococcoidia bacterium]|nr:hypothetical protein [Dehalococcoidia bacterium]
MTYAEVAVDSPHSGGRAFSYSIPPDLRVEVGQAVWVPFGPLTIMGVVMELSSEAAVEDVRDIAGVAHPQPLVSLS